MTMAPMKMTTSSTRPRQRVLDIAYTPDSDDAFNFYAWEKHRLPGQPLAARFHRDHIIALNHAAADARYDVVAISSVMYGNVSDEYAIMSVGNSTGRGYGPVLVSKDYEHVSDLRGKRVAVAGIPTTGGALAMMYCPGAEFVEVTYDQIADGIVRGDFAAGVMIHEELLFFPEKGLHAVADLGEVWCDDTGLPLPVGLNLVRRSLGDRLMHEVAKHCVESFDWAKAHYDEAFQWASNFGRGCAKDHVAMFSNDDTRCLPDDVRAALPIMFDRVAALGLAPRVDHFEVIDA